MNPRRRSVRRRLTFFAHSTCNRDRSDWHVLRDHLEGTAARCEAFASAFGAADVGRLAGLLHDIGKYSPEFQRRLAGESIRVDHSTAGAKIAETRWQGHIGRMLAFCIAGHHAGLANGIESGARSSLTDRLRGEFGREIRALNDVWQRDIRLPESLSLREPMLRDRERGGFQYAFLTRMLFSCLVDADYLDTEEFYASTKGRSVDRGSSIALNALREPLDRHVGRFRADTPLNRVRAQVLEHVRRQSTLEPGVFSLTVPTGGGKTLTSLAFALDHAITHDLRRVIYVIPFTSIIEQTAAVFRRVLGAVGELAVLEHHSAFIDDPGRASEGPEKLQLAMENWDAPLIVTTAVQFFESLFGDRPAACRKLHRIAGSVLILDEAQTLPLKLLRPCVAALDELTLNYGASVVMCTATQPALAETDHPTRSFPGGLRRVRELAPDPKQLYANLRRVIVSWPDGDLDDAALAGQLRERLQVLCIVNNRRHARALYEAIVGEPGARHLSTLMCAKHRSEVLHLMRQDLAADRPCRLIATSLIEAGVDVDFPFVLRAEAGIDSIAQAAGRCNREGRHPPEQSEVRVFRAPQWPPPAELNQFAQAAREVMRRHRDPLSLEAIEDYFRLLYWQREAGGDSLLDAHDLIQRMHRARLNVPFEEVARYFRMIESDQAPVIIPYDYLAREALRKLAWPGNTERLHRTLQPYIVQVPRRAMSALRAAGAVQPVQPERYGDQYLQLASPALYSDAVGLRWDDPTFVESEKLMW